MPEEANNLYISDIGAVYPAAGSADMTALAATDIRSSGAGGLNECLE